MAIVGEGEEEGTSSDVLAVNIGSDGGSGIGMGIAILLLLLPP